MNHLYAQMYFSCTWFVHAVSPDQRFAIGGQTPQGHSINSRGLQDGEKEEKHISDGHVSLCSVCSPWRGAALRVFGLICRVGGQTRCVPNGIEYFFLFQLNHRAKISKHSCNFLCVWNVLQCCGSELRGSGSVHGDESANQRSIALDSSPTNQRRTCFICFCFSTTC